MIEVGLLIFGFALLIKGADIFVNASVGIAKRLKIPRVLIGLTIVAIGTAAPEAVISVTASVQGANGLAVGNIVGSNIFNLMFIIGLCAVIKPMAVKLHEILKDFWLSIIAAAMLLGFMVFSGNIIPRIGSLLFLLVFIGYMIVLVRQALKAKSLEGLDANEGKESVEEIADKIRPLPMIILFALFGCAMIIVGGQLTVDNATQIAMVMGVSERVIGLTIIAIGTSLPELITSLVACKKGENEFALGNIIGSNIFNILFILGVAGLISPLEIESGLVIDTIFLVIGSLFALLFVYTNKRLGRSEGLAMVLMYIGYMIFAVLG